MEQTSIVERFFFLDLKYFFIYLRLPNTIEAFNLDLGFYKLAT